MNSSSRIVRGAPIAALAAAAVALAGLGALAGLAGAQNAGAPPDARDALSGEALIRGLSQVKGCLGVDAGGWQSGKQTIIAWFEDKAAVKRWYYSEAHQSMMDAFTSDESDVVPLKHVPDDAKPIMVLATLTPSATPKYGDVVGMPISQISIELFQPLPGGAHVGGRLAPETFVVPHMRDYTSKAPPGTGG